jgi:hypothetical protein
MKKVKKGYWRMKDERTIRIADMLDQHLIHSMKMLERAKDSLASKSLDFAAGCRGEMATYYADQEADGLLAADVADVFPKFAELEDEARKRSLFEWRDGQRVYSCPMTCLQGRCVYWDGHEGEHAYTKQVTSLPEMKVRRSR